MKRWIFERKTKQKNHAKISFFSKKKSYLKEELLVKAWIWNDPKESSTHLFYSRKTIIYSRRGIRRRTRIFRERIRDPYSSVFKRKYWEWDGIWIKSIEECLKMQGSDGHCPSTLNKNISGARSFAFLLFCWSEVLKTFHHFFYFRFCFFLLSWSLPQREFDFRLGYHRLGLVRCLLQRCYLKALLQTQRICLLGLCLFKVSIQEHLSLWKK